MEKTISNDEKELNELKKELAETDIKLNNTFHASEEISSAVNNFTKETNPVDKTSDVTKAQQALKNNKVSNKKNWTNEQKHDLALKVGIGFLGKQK